MSALLAETPVSTGLETLTEAFTWILTRFTNMAEQMLSTPLFLIGIAIFAVGAFFYEVILCILILFLIFFLIYLV